jgi:phosphoglycerol transferase MdoB-like AlkP superfamily enzyme
VLQPTQQAPPWWVRAYLLVGAAQGLAIAVTGLVRPAHVVGFPLRTTPLNVRFVACFYLAGATGLLASAIVRRAVDTRIYLAGFTAVTALLLIATVWYWSTYTDGGIPYPWTGSYVIEPVVGLAAIATLGLWRPALPGRHRMSVVYEVQAAAFGVLGLVLAAAPDTAVRIWPWALTPVLARTYAAIFLAFALGAGLASRERRPQAVRPFALSSLVLVGATAVVSLVHHGKFDGGLSTGVWAAALAVGVAGLGAAVAATLRREPA